MKIKLLNRVLYLHFLTVVQKSWSLSSEIVWNLHAGLFSLLLDFCWLSLLPPMFCCVPGDSIFFCLFLLSETFQPLWRNTDQNYDFEEMERRGGMTLVYENSWGVNSDLLLE